MAWNTSSIKYMYRNFCLFVFKKESEAGEMVLCLRVLVLVEDLGVVPSTHTVGYSSLIPVPGDTMHTLTPVTCGGVLTYMQVNYEDT